ncbi:hypothetical protein BDZ91DRAFT_767560 [Kalaharituber pfeilii]|nr:hypothetical protein BDZ91DRAFT_767560 [Kalaharituber pfeilii]
MMKELKVQQLEAQKRVDAQIAEMKAMVAAPKPYYSPNRYENWEYPAVNRTNLRGCYWDGEGVGDSVRVSIPVEKDGIVEWQKDWVATQLRKKESEMSSVGCITLLDERVEKINGEKVIYQTARQKATRQEADLEEKRGRQLHDKGENTRNKRPQPRTPSPSPDTITWHQA